MFLFPFTGNLIEGKGAFGKSKQRLGARLPTRHACFWNKIKPQDDKNKREDEMFAQ